MKDIHSRVAEVLIDIEKELRELRLWETLPPTPQALASTQPFCIDALTFPQWLQFIFLPRMRDLVENKFWMPQNCKIMPMAEEYFAPLTVNAGALIDKLGRIDDILSAAPR